VLVLGLVGLFIAVSCVKQKDCEEGISGTFQYLEKPLYMVSNCSNKEKKVTAVIFLDDDNYTDTVYITGNIPAKYKSGNLIKVRFLLCDENWYGPAVICGPSVNKLKCIEKED